MKFFIFVLCSLSAFLLCHGFVNRKHSMGNGDDFFPQKIESSNTFSNWPTNEKIAEGIGKLTTSLLHDIHARAGKNFNIILSPISIWTILAMLLEGAGGHTEVELQGKLQIPFSSQEEEKRVLRFLYQQLQNYLKAGNSNTEFTSLNFIISDQNKPLSPTYLNLINQFYDAKSFQIGTKDVERYASMINAWAREASGYRISSIVTPSVLNNLALVIGNAVYFKSKWKYPFDFTLTEYLPFKDENERIIASVPMMNQFMVLPFSYNLVLDAQIVEIPYSDGVTSMVIIFPRVGVPLLTVLSQMRYLSLDTILPRNMSEEALQLSIPKFRVLSKMSLNEILKQDIPSAFDHEFAEFPYIGNNLYVSKVTHKAEIQNTEEGTTASAVSSVQFTYKSSGVVVRIDRPFIYLINEKNTRTVLFAGTYSNPFNAQT